MRRHTGRTDTPAPSRLPPAWRAQVAAIRDDHTSGAAALTAQAVAALGALAARLADSSVGADTARPSALLRAAVEELAAAQPVMAPLRRLGWSVLIAAGNQADAATVAGAVRAAAAAFIAAMQAHQEQAAIHAAMLLPSQAAVLTHSASSAVEAALRRAYAAGRLAHVTCLEARPLCEGRALAQHLAAAGIPTTLAVDALAARLVGDMDAVLVGGDTVAPGGLINKAGTAALALAARACRVPVYAVCPSEKLLPRLPRTRRPARQRRGFAVPDRAQPPEEVHAAAPPGVAVANYYFDRTPLHYLTAIVTEAGPLSPPQVRSQASGLLPPSQGQVRAKP
ncbi:MAG: hypothetical protein OXU67_07535 [Chloroflexota bacterium]|nr:hypothetical protein [Chloroflexota bacterium]